MCSAVTKLHGLILGSVAFIIVPFCVSCSRGGNDKNAVQLLTRANELVEHRKFSEAIAVIDSLDSIYRGQTEIRRKGMEVKAKAREGSLVRQLELFDSLIALNTLEAQTLSANLVKVDNPIEPYYKVSGGAVPQGVEARISPDGMLYLISRLKSPQIGHVAIEIKNSTGNSAITPEVARDGERNDMVGGVETVHFVEAEADSIGSFVARHRDEPLTLVFISSTGKSYSTPLESKQAEAVAIAYRYAAVVREGKLLHIRREGVERQLQVARNQVARITSHEPATP